MKKTIEEKIADGVAKGIAEARKEELAKKQKKYSWKDSKVGAVMVILLALVIFFAMGRVIEVKIVKNLLHARIDDYFNKYLFIFVLSCFSMFVSCSVFWWKELKEGSTSYKEVIFLTIFMSVIWTMIIG